MILKRFILFFIFISCTPTERTSPPYIEPAHTYSPYELSCIESLNSIRVSHGLNALILSNGLSTLAEGHAVYLSTNQFVNHNYIGYRISYAVEVMGFIYLSENVAYGYSNVESLIAAWLESDGHRDNLLGSKHMYHGFAISSDNDGKMYYVHIFSH